MGRTSLPAVPTGLTIEGPKQALRRASIAQRSYHAIRRALTTDQDQYVVRRRYGTPLSIGTSSSSIASVVFRRSSLVRSVAFDTVRWAVVGSTILAGSDKLCKNARDRAVSSYEDSCWAGNDGNPIAGWSSRRSTLFLLYSVNKTTNYEGCVRVMPQSTPALGRPTYRWASPVLALSS